MTTVEELPDSPDRAPAGSSSAPAPDISRLAEHLFRHESGKLVSILTGIFGLDRLQLAEDVVQEALIRAFRTWPFYGVPKNPAAWLTQTAKNLALDVLRREKLFHEKQPEIIGFVESWGGADEDEGITFDSEIQDQRLRLMFACCHPAIPQDAQAALALKTLCGFSPAEIAKAFLSTEAAIAKRLTRTRQKIQELGLPFEIPAGNELAPRLDGVLQSLYLLFNEGYKASSGDNLVREELCREAIRLAALLAAHPAGNQPRTHALLALMLLNAARLPARADSDGNILRLQEQDRSLWDSRLISLGMSHLSQSAKGEELTEYHLQAGIAACHCLARDYQSTDWNQILKLYDRLLEIEGSPVMALNRAVAAAKVYGPARGLEEVKRIQNRDALESYYLLYAVLAELQSDLKEFAAARKNWERALQLADTRSEKNFLATRIRECEQRLSSASPALAT